MSSLFLGVTFSVQILCTLDSRFWSGKQLPWDEVTDNAKKAKDDFGAGKLKNDPMKDIQKPKSYHLGPKVFENAVFDDLSDSDDDNDPLDEDDYNDDDVDMDPYGEYRPQDWD